MFWAQKRWGLNSRTLLLNLELERDFPFSPSGWCCLVSSSFVWCCVSPLILRGAAWFLPFLFLLRVVLRFSSLLLGGAAWSPPSLAFFPLLLCGAAWFLPSMWVVFLFFLFPFGDASFDSLGCGCVLHLFWWSCFFLQSSVGWCCLVSSFLVASLGWCSFGESPFGGPP